MNDYLNNNQGFLPRSDKDKLSRISGHCFLFYMSCISKISKLKKTKMADIQTFIRRKVSTFLYLDWKRWGRRE